MSTPNSNSDPSPNPNGHSTTAELASLATAHTALQQEVRNVFTSVQQLTNTTNRHFSNPFAAVANIAISLRTVADEEESPGFSVDIYPPADSASGLQAWQRFVRAMPTDQRKKMMDMIEEVRLAEVAKQEAEMDKRKEDEAEQREKDEADRKRAQDLDARERDVETKEREIRVREQRLRDEEQNARTDELKVKDDGHVAGNNENGDQDEKGGGGLNDLTAEVDMISSDSAGEYDPEVEDAANILMLMKKGDALLGKQLRQTGDIAAKAGDYEMEADSEDPSSEPISPANRRKRKQTRATQKDLDQSDDDDMQAASALQHSAASTSRSGRRHVEAEDAEEPDSPLSSAGSSPIAPIKPKSSATYTPKPKPKSTKNSGVSSVFTGESQPPATANGKRSSGIWGKPYDMVPESRPPKFEEPEDPELIAREIRKLQKQARQKSSSGHTATAPEADADSVDNNQSETGERRKRRTSDGEEQSRYSKRPKKTQGLETVSEAAEGAGASSSIHQGNGRVPHTQSSATRGSQGASGPRNSDAATGKKHKTKKINFPEVDGDEEDDVAGPSGKKLKMKSSSKSNISRE